MIPPTDYDMGFNEWAYTVILNAVDMLLQWGGYYK